MSERNSKCLRVDIFGFWSILFPDSLVPEKDTLLSDPSDATGTIAGVISALVAVCILVVIAIAISRWRKRRGERIYVYTVELQWLEHLVNHENMFEKGVVRANECKSKRQIRRHNRDIFSSFFNMKVCCVFSLKSPHRGDFNEYTQYTIFNIKKIINLTYPKFAAMGFFPRDTRTSSKQPW